MTTSVMVEFFSGSGQMAAAFRECGWTAYTIDNNEKCKPDILADIFKLTAQDIVSRCGIPSAVWLSPPCQAFSVCTISKNWKKGKPISKKAALSLRLITHARIIVEELRRMNPTMKVFWENPRGMLRKQRVLEGIPRYTVTYCQYGDFKQKPTDIWTDSGIVFKKPCAAGAACHEASPRGATGGTQSLANDYERSKIPENLCRHVAEFCTRTLAQPPVQRTLEVVAW